MWQHDSEEAQEVKTKVIEALSRKDAETYLDVRRVQAQCSWTRPNTVIISNGKTKRAILAIVNGAAPRK